MIRQDFLDNLSKYLPKNEVDLLVESLFTRRKQGLLLNTEKLDEVTLLRYFPSLEKHPLIKNGYIYDPEVISPGKHFLFDAGAYYLQDLSAMMVSHLLPLDENDIVLDLAAAPGGKTIQTSLKMNNKGLIIANDISKSRAEILVNNVERMGRANVIVTNENALDLAKKLPPIFSKIILDAPCSGSGMFKKDDKMIEDWSINKVKKYQEIQKDLILAAFSLLIPGGIMVYSTCSFSYEENEDVIFALEKEVDVKRINIPVDPSFYRDASLKEAIHLLPSHFEGDGQFIALLQKPGELKVPSLTIDKRFFFNNELNLHEIKINKEKYGLTVPYLPKYVNILRAGVRLTNTINKTVTPHHHLSHYLSSTNSVALNESDFHAYIHGNTLKNPSLKDGFYVVKYEDINLGYVKSVNGTLKNLYPKGLRH